MMSHENEDNDYFYFSKMAPNDAQIKSDSKRSKKTNKLQNWLPVEVKE